jgi:two-component system sensor histidine kinase ChvG
LRRAVDPADSRANEAIALIDSSASRLNTLIAAAQSIDNATADSIEGPRPLDLHVLVRQVVAGFRESANPRGITFNLDMASAWVSANEDALEVAVENVLDNAIGFSPDKGMIAVNLARNGGDIELTVCDQGPGVAGDLIDHVFDRYCSSRGDAPGRADDPHSGLGLWIVRRNIEAAGGTVSAANLDTRGFCVRIRLPACPVPA